ncbi:MULTISPECIES: DUF1161 domain-containing protein [Edwardsiella]|uniref:DUF1161 domain-containing protein n=2 Tax=Edwardsiella anguillarum TaxID=1821960 RepID=A0A076LU09_9GAMM|nr:MULTISPECIES: DUF1161 domain-containing protein [Edwardsiella]AKM47884.1 membrane protein [Edwardsiella sp. EA181011]GAJ68861.1 hypothetical protein MA13_contig00014-0054 [Edwardsiella piscicida]AIJ10182.1 Hypothetical protein ETEE_3770 [Edwardsiella anguillarum ET080813]AKR77751.1 DUF1161 domain-containing protein [Edwardsiella sp. LADL05-105]KAB0592143.1 DUF1161 domain-containing protein [Edwardsiella anguillarum]
MHKPILLSALLLAPLFSYAAASSCESIRDEISQKIVANGVPQEAFTLEIVPNDQVQQAGGQVVGHCGNDTQKIVYIRTDGAEPGAHVNPR